jgi:hypothetical protein
MEDVSYLSEKYRKYLLEVIFAGNKYYTVFGADLSDSEIDKLLVDNDGNILLFSNPADLLAMILKGTSFFDNERLHKWAEENLDVIEPYTVVNFDILTKGDIGFKDIQSFKSIYYTLGIIDDYSNQVSDKGLFTLLKKDILLQFKEDLSDYFIWSESEAFKILVDVDILFLSLKKIYEKLKGKLRIYQ